MPLINYKRQEEYIKLSRPEKQRYATVLFFVILSVSPFRPLGLILPIVALVLFAFLSGESKGQNFMKLIAFLVIYSFLGSLYSIINPDFLLDKLHLYYLYFYSLAIIRS